MDSSKRIFALGFFDGVHLGHQALLKQCCALADRMACQTAAITFQTHPKSLFSGPVPLISTANDRVRLLRQYGIGSVYTYPVTEEVLGMPWEAFLEELLEYGAAGFVCGDDFRFGHKGAGSAETLNDFCMRRNLPCVIVPEQTIGGIRVSSTHIRQLLEQGQMEEVNRFLGHPYTLTDTVIPGKQLGRTMGIPTANLALPKELAVPKFGVYACLANVEGKTYPAVTNVGVRPTVSGTGITVEPWILDFSGDIYGKRITLDFYKFLRPEQPFPSLDALRQEIHRNADQTRTYFENREGNGI